MLTRICASVAAMVMTASVAFAGSVQAADRKDFQVLKDVATSVERYVHFTIFDSPREVVGEPCYVSR